MSTTKARQERIATMRVPIGCRYPADLIPLLDRLAAEDGHETRADLIRAALDDLLRARFPEEMGARGA